MAKSSHLNIISLLLPAITLIPCIICVFFNAPVVLHPLTTNFIGISTDSPISSASAPAQNTIPAPRKSIVIGEFKFRIAKVAFDETAMGFVPVDMDPDDQVMFVEFELLEGSKESFKALEIMVADGSGHKSKAFILTSAGMIQMLATVVMESTSSYYQPGEDRIAWAYVVPRGVSDLYLNFPTGEMIDLTPHIKSFSCLAIELCQEYRNLDSKPFSISGFFVF